ncbi:MAG: hypothetical protein KJ714_02245 [Euryarchaeota archaeon]|nr:hypothetical protein [Euryarchaeota archaeon]
MKEAFIIHGIADANHYAEHRHKEDALLFSTHSCVDMYLKASYGLRCNCLSGFFDIDEMISRRVTSYRLVDEVLALLDKRVSPQVNQAAGFNIDYFRHLYSYAGRYQFTNYVFFVKALRRMCDFHKVDKVHLYDWRFNFILDTETDMGALATLFLQDLPHEIVRYTPEKPKLSYLRQLFKTDSVWIFKRLKDPFGTLEKVYKKISIEVTLQRYKKLSPHKKTIVISEPLCALSFLIHEKLIEKYNIVYYRHNSRCFTEDNTTVDGPNVKVEFAGIQGDFGEYAPYANLFISDISSDFSKHINGCLRNIQKLAALHRRHPISLGIWGLDPCLGDKAIRYAYLQSEGVRVLGAQHGGLYGETMNMQYETDFNRCDYFIGYGFTKEDLLRLAPDKSFKAEILPIGKTDLVRPQNKIKRIDILFPITNTISMLEGGMIRIPPDRLTERQITLLNYLNSLKDTAVYVKPFSNVDHANLSVWTMLKKLRNLHICDHLTLNTFLKKFHPRAVLIEYPSQPLWEIMHLDTEIFLMGDPVLPWESQALEEVQRRVHYSENTGETIQMIDSFLRGELTRKRDSTFFNHYVSMDHAKENILKTIERLMMTKDSNS